MSSQGLCRLNNATNLVFTSLGDNLNVLRLDDDDSDDDEDVHE
ncbi:unnamed protein product, partial [Rotaria magnacalcarata]